MKLPLIKRLALKPPWLLILVIAGCSPAPTSNLSPTSDQDPDRYQRAVQENEEKVRKDQEAERKAFQNLGRSNPSP